MRFFPYGKRHYSYTCSRRKPAQKDADCNRLGFFLGHSWAGKQAKRPTSETAMRSGAHGEDEGDRPN